MLAAARSGSNRAWAALLQHLDAPARGLAHLVLGGHGVDAVLQGAYVRAFRARRKGGDDAVVFLLHHVWTACGHEVRRRQRQASPAPGRRAAPDDAAPRFGDGPLARAVASLRPEERAVWALVERDALPPEVAAAALGVDPTVVAGVAERVRARLADADADDPDEVAPAPPGATFWSELGHQLRAEREALPAAPPPKLPAPGDPSPALTPAKAPPVAMQKRAPRRSRRSQPDLVEGLAEEAERQRERRPWRSVARRVVLVALPLAALAGVVVALYLAASSAKSPVRGTTTATLAGASLERLASEKGWSATATRTVVAPDGTRSTVTQSVAVTDDGSYRVEEAGGGRVTTYDARLGLLQDTVPGFGIRHELGVAPGGPDPSPPRAEMPQGEISLAARTLATATGTEPARIEAEGVEVWALSGELDDGLRLTYTVRVADLLPVRILWERDEAVVREVRFADVTLGRPAVAFSQELPADAPDPTPVGFVPVPLGEIRSRVDLVPLTPDHLPAGFTFTGAAVQEEARVVSLRYARGPAEIVVTLRPSPVEAGRPWDDPFDRGAEAVQPEELTLGQGPFRDVPAQAVSGGMALPSVWGADGERAFTVAGDLSPDELLAVARSLG